MEINTQIQQNLNVPLHALVAIGEIQLIICVRLHVLQDIMEINLILIDLVFRNVLLLIMDNIVQQEEYVYQYATPIIGQMVQQDFVLMWKLNVQILLMQMQLSNFVSMELAVLLQNTLIITLKDANPHALIQPLILEILLHICVLLSVLLLQIIILKMDIVCQHVLEPLQIIKIKEHV